MSSLPILQKPRFGEPCNGCGECCVAYPCGLARTLIGCEIGPCAALEKHGEIFQCGLMLRPLHYLPGYAEGEFASEALSFTFKALLGAGKGCCSSDPQTLAFAAENKGRKKLK